MSIRTVRYFVEPPKARPLSLIDANGRPTLNCEFDTSQVAHAGFSEILQTSHHANPLFGLFEDLLASNNSQLVWQGSGPGLGVEMRRTFSALFGRFFARAYLERYHGFTWFAPLDGKETRISRRIRVRRTTRRGDMPDWLCSSPNRIAIAEAKGTRSPANVRQGKLPGPLETAKEQILRARVETLRLNPRTQRMLWTSRQVKGWGVMSRWATEQSNRPPLLYVMDPETEGSPIADDEVSELSQDIARFHVARLLEGIGATDLATRIDEVERPSTDASSGRELVTAEVPGQGKIELIGSVFGPQKILRGEIARLRGSLEQMPPELAEQILFIGLDRSVVSEALARTPIVVRKYSAATSAETRTFAGSDGLFVLPLSQVIETHKTFET